MTNLVARLTRHAPSTMKPLLKRLHGVVTYVNHKPCTESQDKIATNEIEPSQTKSNATCYDENATTTRLHTPEEAAGNHKLPIVIGDKVI